MNQSILLSFDIEEFDIPEEYGQKIENTVKFAVSLNGLKSILSLLDKLNIHATFFVTANFAFHNQTIIREVTKNHEIASHGFYHSEFRIEDLKTSRLFLSEITGNKVVGFRMPRLKEINEQEIIKAGYEYNSSINPTYLPGKYNNFWKPRTAYYSNNLLNIPVSVTPIIRCPLFWLSFKNFPLWLTKLNSQITLQHDRYLNIYFHPWEFTDITSFKLPSYIKRYSGEPMINRLEKYLIWLKSQGEFICFSQFKQSWSHKQFQIKNSDAW